MTVGGTLVVHGPFPFELKRRSFPKIISKQNWSLQLSIFWLVKQLC